MATINESLLGAPLGAKSDYRTQYDKTLLFPITRKIKRDELGIKGEPIFTGYDIWNAYEVSWLNPKGKPQVAIAEFFIPASSDNIIESKSFKLYLNSLNNTKFADFNVVEKLLKNDISSAVNAPIIVKLQKLEHYHQTPIISFTSECLDDRDIECDTYSTDDELLKLKSKNEITLTVYSNLLKSNCLVTGQPDWGSVEIDYTGPEISKDSLLQYIVSFRNHNEFHEQCVERIFMDIYNKFKPKALTVFARYTRRGGLDINPLRSLTPITNIESVNNRQARQ
jgi:7-cyano-7-deazaguanine reductase